MVSGYYVLHEGTMKISHEHGIIRFYTAFSHHFINKKASKLL